MMAKTVTQGRRPDATAGTDTIHRSLFDSFNPDSGILRETGHRCPDSGISSAGSCGTTHR